MNISKTTYCHGKHAIKVESRGHEHPVLRMTKARAKAWEKHASDEQFYIQLQELAAIYAKRHYIPGTMIDDTALFKDFKKWSDDAKIGVSTSKAVD